MCKDNPECFRMMKKKSREHKRNKALALNEKRDETADVLDASDVYNENGEPSKNKPKKT